MTRAFSILLVCATGCGRIGFDTASAIGTGDGGSNGGDAALGGDSSDGALTTDGHVPVAPTFVQHTAAETQTDNVTVAYTDAVVAGNLLVIGLDYDQSTPTVPLSLTDTLGDTFTLTGPDDYLGTRQYIAYAIAGASGADTVTAMLDHSSVSYLDLRVHEYADASTTAPFDAAASANGTSVAVDGAVSGTVTTAEPNELLFGLVIDDTVTAGTQFTARGLDFGDLTEDMIATTPGDYAAVATATGAWSASVAAFRGR